MANRSFRTAKSYVEERTTRSMLPDFLRSRGFFDIDDVRKTYGNTESQTISATSPAGQPIAMRVRLCWYRGKVSGRSYSAAQLLSSVKDGDWEGSLHRKIQRDEQEGVTHYLFVQREDQQIKYAALIPVSEVLPIWIDQRDVSVELINKGKLGRATKNHAMNGSSPTLYLHDDRAPQVALVLWNHRGVWDLAGHMPARGLADHEADEERTSEDEYHPLPGDLREIVNRQIRERRGQTQFRDVLRRAFNNECVVTGSRVVAVLEAAHINPYRGPQDNNPQNGLLLRSDIHTLFDLDLLGINPETLAVELHPILLKEYGYLADKVITCSRQNKLSRQALRVRYLRFRKTLLEADVSDLSVTERLIA